MHSYAHRTRQNEADAAMSDTAPKSKEHISENARWMTLLGDSISSRPLNDLALPGAHRVGTESVPDGPGAIANSASRCLRCAELIAPVSVDGWLRTQDTGILQLLNAGVRYFDLRASHDDNNRVLIGFPGRGSSINDVVRDVRLFLKYEPSEIIILHFRRLHAFSAGAYQDLAEFLIQSFDGLLISPDERGGRVPVGELWEQEGRVILAFPENMPPETGNCQVCGRRLDNDNECQVKLRPSLRSMIWPHHLIRTPEAAQTTIAVLKNYLSEELHRPKGKELVVIDAVLQPSTEVIAEGQIGRSVMFFKNGEDLLSGCIPGFLRGAVPRFWRDCFPDALAQARLAPTTRCEIGRESVIPNVVAWLKHDWPGLPLNIISVDAINGSGLIELLVQRNADTENLH